MIHRYTSSTALSFLLMWVSSGVVTAGSGRLIHIHRAFPRVLRTWRPVAFVAGMLVLLAASGSLLAMLDHHYLTAHMAQHLLLMTVAVPLILLGAPIVTVLHGLPPSLSGRFFCRPVDGWLARAIAQPVFCWLSCTAVVIGWHIPAVFQIGMRSEFGHAVEQFCFFTAGILFWWPVIQPWPAVAKWPVWSIPVCLFLAALRCDALSAFLCLCNRVVYSHYLPAQSFELPALKDQACAGALMWVWVTFRIPLPSGSDHVPPAFA